MPGHGLGPGGPLLMKRSLKQLTADSPLPLVLLAPKKRVFHLWEIWETHTVSPQRTIQFLLPAGRSPAWRYRHDSINPAGGSITIQVGWWAWIKGFVESGFLKCKQLKQTPVT